MWVNLPGVLTDSKHQGFGGKCEENREESENLMTTILLIWSKRNLLLGLRKTHDGEGKLPKGYYKLNFKNEDKLQALHMRMNM